jgi:tripartite-type tricarboxylate transporter receptor subunit TctC
MLEDGAILVGNTPEQFMTFIQSEQSRWSKVIKQAKITID